MAYTLSNKCAKNLCKWTVLFHLIVENVVTCFLEHSVEVTYTVFRKKNIYYCFLAQVTNLTKTLRQNS